MSQSGKTRNLNFLAEISVKFIKAMFSLNFFHSSCIVVKCFFSWKLLETVVFRFFFFPSVFCWWCKRNWRFFHSKSNFIFIYFSNYDKINLFVYCFLSILEKIHNIIQTICRNLFICHYGFLLELNAAIFKLKKWFIFTMNNQ